MALLAAVASAVAISLISLIGILIINQRSKKVFLLVSFAVGALFGDAFIHIIPEAFANGENSLVSASILVGIMSFLALEKFLRWRHSHGDYSNTENIHPVAWLNLISDFFHNFFDGIAIGVSYLLGFPLGVATTLAIILHEIPQELGDYAILITSGMKKRTALIYNFLISLTAIVGATIPFVLEIRTPDIESMILPFVAGGFIYIAGTDLLPMIHEKVRKEEIKHFLAIVVGMLFMLLLKTVG
ncbi:MAG: ZIP family metal transporter [Methanobacteriota archaeon]|nr:MAG: ZIP family metal transporter [Euryarchaeota archaeon]